MSVEAVRLSQLLAAHMFPRVDLLKIDAEGAEPDVCKDLRESGWLPKVRWLRMEWHLHAHIARIEALLSDTHAVDVQPGQYRGLLTACLKHDPY